MNVLVAANDPGGANALVPVVRQLLEGGVSVRALITGPACDTFSRAGVPFEDVQTYSDEQLEKEIGIFKPTLFLAGTSGGTQIDKKIFPLVAGKIPTVYILDFWNNYTSRFSKENADLMYLPDIICVMDEQAKKEMIAEGIPETHIAVTGNPYFEHFTQGITKDTEDKKRILFISQPIAEGEDIGFTEFDALADIISAVEKLPRAYHLSLRLHPRDDKNKYDSYCTSRVSLSAFTLLEKDLSTAGLVIGMFSPVLIQSALAGKSVISYEPHLLVSDPLPTNLSGLTPLASDTKILRELIGKYLQSQPLTDVPGEWNQSGATQNVLKILTSVVL